MDATLRCEVVKIIGDYNDIKVATPPLSYEDGVRWIEGKRYWGTYAIRDRESGRLLSMVLFKNRGQQ